MSADISPVIRAVLAYVRDLSPDEMDALVGNPLRQAGDAALWAHLLTLPPDRLGLLIADGVTDANRNRIVLPLLDEHVLAAWAAADEWGATLGDTPEIVTRLGRDAGRWTR